MLLVVFRVRKELGRVADRVQLTHYTSNLKMTKEDNNTPLIIKLKSFHNNGSLLVVLINLALKFAQKVKSTYHRAPPQKKHLAKCTTQILPNNKFENHYQYQLPIAATPPRSALV